jgi:hypothetical protein
MITAYYLKISPCEKKFLLSPCRLVAKNALHGGPHIEKPDTSAHLPYTTMAMQPSMTATDPKHYPHPQIAIP